MRVTERAERVVGDHPTGRVEEQARKCQALLLVERQLSVPALGTLERGDELGEVHPLERGDHHSILKLPGRGGIAHRGTQRAEGEIGPLRHERHRLARRHSVRSRRRAGR